MKRLILLAILATSPVLHVFSANLITNPGFENGATAPTDWGTWSSGSFTYLKNQTPGVNCHTGTRAVSIQNPSPFVAAWYNTPYTPVTSGQVFRVSAWLRSVTFDLDDFVIIYFDQYDAANNWIDTTCSSGFLGNSNWRQITAVFTNTDPHVAKTQVSFVFGGGGSGATGQAIFDDVSLDLLSSPPSPSAVTAIRIVGNQVTLSISNIASGATNYLVSTPSLSIPWTTCGTFVATSTFTNWCETPTNQWARRFYRLITAN